MEFFFLRFPCPYQARPAEAPDVCISPDRFRNTVAHSDRPPEFRRGNVRTAPAAWRFRWMLPCEYSDHIFHVVRRQKAYILIFKNKISEAIENRIVMIQFDSLQLIRNTAADTLIVLFILFLPPERFLLSAFRIAFLSILIFS